MPDETEAMPDPVAEALEPKKRKAPPRAGHSNRKFTYACAECKREVGREGLVQKRVQFVEIGVGGKVLKTAATGWLCRVPQDNGDPSCMEKDPAYQQERWRSSPGFADIRERDHSE